MTFYQACLMLGEMSSLSQERQESVKGIAKGMKELMPVIDIARAVYE